VGRAQAILYHLYLLLKNGRIPPLPIFLDSPMAIDATAMLKRHPGDHKLSDAECAAVCAVPRYVHTPEESKAINATNGMPKVIISASGMATGGRVLHHLKHYIGDIRSTVLFAGYQAAETRGEKLLRGDKTIKIHGQEWEVRAQIAQLNGLSAHADYVEILEWLRHFRQGPKRTFIVHGEPHAAQSLRDKIIERYGWEVEIPTYAQQVEM
jgi:metallo-beta-lactamase family protein